MSAPIMGAAAAAAADRASEIAYIAHTLAGALASIGTAEGTVRFLSNGDLSEITTDGTPSPAIGSAEWNKRNILTGIGDDWEIFATLTSGTTPVVNAGLGSWIRLDATRSWGNTRASGEGVGVTTSTLTFAFGLFGTSTALVTVTGTIVSAEQTV